MRTCPGLLALALLLTIVGCFPHDATYIGAVDPTQNIPAIQNAGQTKDAKAVPALVGQLNNDDPAVRFYAIEALQRITGQTFDYHFYDDVDIRRPALALAGLFATAEVAVTASMTSIRFRTTSDPANLAQIRHEIESFCSARGFRDPALGEIVLSANEAVTNITRHAYHGATDKPIEIEAGFEQNRLKLAIRDWGSGKQPPRIPSDHDPLRPGGVGLMCMGKLMDQVEYTPQPDGMLLTMYRQLPKL